MTRRPVILTLTLGLALLIDADVVGDRVRPEQRPLTASGRVYMVTSPDGLTTAERDELTRLRRENRQLRQERDILAKAAAWFARETGSIPSKSSNS